MRPTNDADRPITVVLNWTPRLRGKGMFNASRSERHDLPGSDALICGEDDAQTVDRILHVIRQVHVLLNRA
jgi:hypothetical protein